jgi:DNA-binding MarR family transcriptional regulator
VIQRLRGWHRNLFRLWLIDPDAEPVPLRQVATRMHFDPSNVTLISAKLDEKGAARRAPHPTDGRVRTLVLTVAGRKMRERLLADAYARSPFRALDAKERRQLSQLLAKALRRQV